MFAEEHASSCNNLILIAGINFERGEDAGNDGLDQFFSTTGVQCLTRDHRGLKFVMKGSLKTGKSVGVLFE